MTSKPASRARTAICSAPLECPSRPGLPTRKRSRPPSSSPVARTRSRMSIRVSSASPPPLAAATPVGARYSPNTSRSTPAHSPVVTPARAQSRVAAIRLTSVPAASRRAPHPLPGGAWARPGVVGGALVALGPPLLHGLLRRVLHGGVDDHDRGVEVGQQRVGLGGLVLVDADDDAAPPPHPAP